MTNTAKLKILCVDDQSDTCDLISLLLSAYDVTAAYNQHEGLARAQESHFDLILLDYHLPDGTGLELCRLIRAFDEIAPILLVTSDDAVSLKDFAAAGGQSIIRKSEIAELVPAVMRAFYGTSHLQAPLRSEGS